MTQPYEAFRKETDEIIMKLQAKLAIAVEVLKFYKDGFLGKSFHGLWDVPAERDGGKKAREALAKIEGVEK